MHMFAFIYKTINNMRRYSFCNQNVETSCFISKCCNFGFISRIVKYEELLEASREKKLPSGRLRKTYKHFNTLST